MAAFSFNFQIDLESEASASDCKEEHDDTGTCTGAGAVFEFVSEGSTSGSVGARQSSAGEESRSEFEPDRGLDCNCGLVSISEDNVAGLCRSDGAPAKVGASMTSYCREVVQLSDSVRIMCLTHLKALHSENLTEDILRGAAPSSQLSVVQQAQKASSDLVAGVYEGGMKVWECAVDLATFLLSNNALCSGRRVMELGCGVGLPGVCALLQGAQLVVFQDYNIEVLTSRTIPTAFCNGALKGRQFQNIDEFSSVCQFCYGDWGTLVQKMSQNGCQWKHGFDVILASETIYCRESYLSFLSALKYFLDPSGGVVYLAAKSYYFGVGGSVAEFQEFVSSDRYFDVQEVATFGQDTVHRTILTLSVRQ